MIRIKVITLGHMPAELDLKKITNKKSSIFSVVSPIENYTINKNSDGDNWEFSDSNLTSQLPQTFDGDFLIAVVNVPLEMNWYSRRLDSNRVVFTFHGDHQEFCVKGG